MSRELDDRQAAIAAVHAHDAGRDSIRIGAYFAACNDGPCKGGRAICPSPQKCLLSEAEFKRRVWRTSIVASAIFVAGLVGGLIYGVLR